MFLNLYSKREKSLLVKEENELINPHQFDLMIQTRQNEIIEKSLRVSTIYFEINIDKVSNIFYHINLVN